MNDLSRLREVSDQVLFGLTANDSMKKKILQKVTDGSKSRQSSVFHPLPVICAVMVGLLVAVVALNRLQPVNPAESVEMNVFAAGIKETVSPQAVFSEETDSVLNGIYPEDVVSVELSGVGIINDVPQCNELMRILKEEAVAAEMEKTVSGSKLIILTEDGSVLEYCADAPYVIGGKSWSCPSFFRLFQQFLDR